jgi:hypothetical protein
MVQQPLSRDVGRRESHRRYALSTATSPVAGCPAFFFADESLHRHLVIKVLPADMAGQLSLERFKPEIALAAQLRHPDIVPLLTLQRPGARPMALAIHSENGAPDHQRFSPWSAIETAATNGIRAATANDPDQ